jgi:hypothetical protein
MKLEINPRGNGACPLCASDGHCRVQENMRAGLALMNGADSEMEVVVYECSYFKEKEQP